MDCAVIYLSVAFIDRYSILAGIYFFFFKLWKQKRVLVIIRKRTSFHERSREVTRSLQVARAEINLESSWRKVTWKSLDKDVRLRDGERPGETGRDAERRAETGRDGERPGETGRDFFFNVKDVYVSFYEREEQRWWKRARFTRMPNEFFSKFEREKSQFCCNYTHSLVHASLLFLRR